jgi:hypothetical protein
MARLLYEKTTTLGLARIVEAESGRASRTNSEMAFHTTPIYPFRQTFGLQGLGTMLTIRCRHGFWNGSKWHQKTQVHGAGAETDDIVMAFNEIS